jgi:hypothetical protein
MPVAELFLIKRYDEFLPKKKKIDIPKNTRGIYVLLKKHGDSFNVVYVGMAGGDKSGIRGRLDAHSRSERKKDAWDHFSVFQVHDNLPREIILELEGLFRHIYRKDTISQQLVRQKKFKKLSNVHSSLSNWKTD